MKKIILLMLAVPILSTARAQTINAAEYFVDTDPGAGNGTAISVTPGANISFSALVPVTSLSQGFHIVAIRAKDNAGKWGHFQQAGFYISSAAVNAGNITAAEFFVDADPGVGSGTAIPVTAGANINFVASIPTVSLTPGFHILAIRVKDVNGRWGLYENKGFYISTQTTNPTGMTEAEYFIDTDPGVGNGTPFTIPGGQSFNQNFVLPVPNGLSQGSHFIAIRVKNQWGLFAFDTITVSGTVPLTFVKFDAHKTLQGVLLNWQTENEVNTSHFIVERSSNGTQFLEIGNVTAANSPGTHNYSLNDLQPIKGVNFYRLKQVDKDGQHKYSHILRILYSNVGGKLNVYPNPASEYVQLDFIGTQKTVLVNIFDAQGKQVKLSAIANSSPLKLNITNLANGRYTVHVSDGVVVQTGSFIKK